MKYFALLIAVAFAWTILPKLSNASCVLPKTKEPALTATKGKKTVKYKTGSFISVAYGLNSKKIHGSLLASRNDDSIRIQPNFRNPAFITISTKDIRWVMKSHKNVRDGWIIVTAILVVLTTVALILSANKNLLALLFYVAPVTALYTYYPYLIVSYLFDLLSKKSVKKGWVFSSQNFSN